MPVVAEQVGQPQASCHVEDPLDEGPHPRLVFVDAKQLYGGSVHLAADPRLEGDDALAQVRIRRRGYPQRHCRPEQLSGVHVHDQLHHAEGGELIVAMMLDVAADLLGAGLRHVLDRSHQQIRTGGEMVLRRPLDPPACSPTTVTVLPDQPTSTRQPTTASNNASQVARRRSCSGPFSEGSIVVTLPSSVAAAPGTTRWPPGHPPTEHAADTSISRSASASASDVARIRWVVTCFEAARPCGEHFRNDAASSATASSGSSVAIVTSPMRSASVASKRSPVRLYRDAARVGQAGQHRERDERGRQAQAGLGQRKTRREPGDGDIVGREQPQTAGTNVALHVGHHRLVQLDDLAQQRNQTRHPPLGRSALASALGEVGTGTEGVGRVDEHDGANGVVGLDVAKVHGEISDQPGINALRFSGESNVSVAIRSAS